MSKRQKVAEALGLDGELKGVYRQAKQAIERLQRYQAGTDPDFNAAVNLLYTSAERNTRGSMLTQLTSLVNAWEADASIRAVLELE